MYTRTLKFAQLLCISSIFRDICFTDSYDIYNCYCVVSKFVHNGKNILNVSKKFSPSMFFEVSSYLHCIKKDKWLKQLLWLTYQYVYILVVRIICFVKKKNLLVIKERKHMLKFFYRLSITEFCRTELCIDDEGL